MVSVTTSPVGMFRYMPKTETETSLVARMIVPLV